MEKNNFKLTTGSILNETFLVSFPIWIPLIYYSILNIFPSSGLLLVYFTFFVFGEIHFGITWLFVFDKKNIEFIKQHKFYSLAVPALLVLFFTICWFFISQMLAFFLSTLFNIFHVTRQSVGITKIYKTRDLIGDIGTNIVYLNSFLCLFYGFCKFIIIKDNLFLLNIIFYAVLSILLLTIIFCILISIRKKNDLNFSFAILTGSILYAPFLLDNINAIHAGAMGIGIHYIQYIALQTIIYSRKKNSNKREHFNFFEKIGNNMGYFLIYLIFYSILMGGLLYLGRDLTQTNEGFFDSGAFNYLFFLPFIMHNLHFYADMFMWRFSNPHIRENVGKYLFS